MTLSMLEITVRTSELEDYIPGMFYFFVKI